MIRRLLLACIVLAGLMVIAPDTPPVSIAQACSACVGTTTSVTSSANPSFTSAPGTTFVLTATVTPTGGGTVDGGTVAFTSNGSTISGCGSVAVSNDTATCTTSTTTQGDYSIEATYGGTPNFDTSSSGLTQTVFKHTTVTSDTYCNSGGVTIPNSAATGPAPLGADPYPSDIFVGPSGQGGVPVNGGSAPESGTITSVTLQISGLTFSDPDDLGLMLSGPNGANFDVMSNVGGATPVTAIDLSFADSATSQVSSGALSSGTFKPTSFPGTDTWASPAPGTFNSAAPAGSSTFATEFSGADANGAWKLYAVTRGDAVSGSFANGWCLTFTMQPTAVRASDFRYVRPGDRITFHWHVADNAGIVGFAILAEPRGGKVRQLNSRLIPTHRRPDYAVTLRYGGRGPFRLKIISTNGQTLGVAGS